MCLINRGVCMFKYGKIKEASEIWMSVSKHDSEHTKHSKSISEFIFINDNCQLPITTIFNLSLSYLV